MNACWGCFGSVFYGFQAFFNDENRYFLNWKMRKVLLIFDAYFAVLL